MCSIMTTQSVCKVSAGQAVIIVPIPHTFTVICDSVYKANELYAVVEHSISPIRILLLSYDNLLDITVLSRVIVNYAVTRAIMVAMEI